MQLEDNREIRREVRDYIISSFYVPDPEALADSASLIKTGIIDDDGVLEMVAFLESTFGVKIGDEEMAPENLDSIARVASFICRKKTCAEPAPADEVEDDGIDELAVGDRLIPEAVELDHINIS